MDVEQTMIKDFIDLDCDKPEHMAAYLDFFPEAHKKDIFHWLYSSRNSKQNHTKSFFMMLDGKPIGFNGLTVVNAQINGNIENVYWSGDFLVDNACRGKGFGVDIKQNLISQTQDACVMSLGIANNAFNLLNKMGWVKPSTPVNNYTRVGQIASARYKQIPRYIVAKSAQLMLKYLPSLFDNNLSKIEYRAVVSDSLLSADIIDHLWSSICGTYRKIVVRDHAYLHWKYSSHPTAKKYYRFVNIYSENKLAGVFIIRLEEFKIHLVDYVGPQNAAEMKGFAVEYCLQNFALENAECTTNDLELASILKKMGFYKKSSTKFLARHKNDKTIANDWFLMGGDSDGELLKASTYAEEYAYKIKLLTEYDFTQLQPQWNQLLDESRADKLFMSWEWQYSWWQAWSKKLELSLYLIAFYKANRLVGLVPLYIDKESSIRYFNKSRIQFIGNRWKTTPTVRSEYIEPLFHISYELSLYKLLAKTLASNLLWGEFTLVDVPSRVATKVIKGFTKTQKRKYKIYEWERNTGVNIGTQNNLDTFKQSLSRNSRSKYINSISKLGKYGILESTLDANQGPAFFEDLNSFHKVRWGKPVFVDESLNFHFSFLEKINSSARLQPMLSVLSDETKVLAVSYNVTSVNKLYNLQSGYNEAYGHGLSLGKVHLGIVIKEALLDPNLTSFDLLAGHGKNSNYKSSLGGEKVNFSTLSIFKNGIRFQIFLVTQIVKRFVKKISKASE